MVNATSEHAPVYDRGSLILCVLCLDSNDVRLLVEDTLATIRSATEEDFAAVRSPVAGGGRNTGSCRFKQIFLIASKVVAERALSGVLESSAGEITRCLTVNDDTAPADALNAVIAASAPADVLLLRAGVQLGRGDLRRMRLAALSDSTVASATPLLRRRVSICPQDTAAPSPLWPRIGTIGSDCAYIRRSALDLLGGLDSTVGLAEALDIAAMRLVASGLVHVGADDVAIESVRSGGSFTDSDVSTALDTTNSVHETIVSDERGVFHRATYRAMGTHRRLSVTIDARSLTSAVGGTQTYVAGLAAALVTSGELSVRILVPPDLPEPSREALLAAGKVQLMSYEQALANPLRTDVVHRPQQVFTPDDLNLLRLLGERLVVTHHDLIAYHNCAYHADLEAWRSHRRVTRLAMAAADQVIFFSEHARRDALAEDLVSDERTHVVGIGPEQSGTHDGFQRAPEVLQDRAPFLLCLGADYAHKNRPFAIRLLAALHELGWHGRLVFAGPHVPYGSSAEDEQETLRGHPDVASWVTDLGTVDEPSKRWLYAHARALLYPTLYEGFGLLPLEAAAWQTPCLFAAQSSLAEGAGDAATLVPWDAAASAAAVRAVLDDGEARDRHLETLTRLKAPTWQQVVSDALGVYRQALTEPSSPAAPRAWQELDRENQIMTLDRDVRHLKKIAQEYQNAYHSLARRVGPGLALIDQGGLLTVEQQRGLMRIASRRWAGSLILGPLGLLGRYGKRHHS